MWEKAVVVYFKVVSHCFPGRTLMFVLFVCLYMLNERQKFHVIELGGRTIIRDELERIASKRFWLVSRHHILYYPEGTEGTRNKNCKFKI
jgi:hypothetical protein